jgi:hypothetical protein
VVYTPPPAGPGLGRSVGVLLLVLLGLLANGRPLGAGDTRANERVAVSLVQEGDFDLDEHPEIEPPFSREVAGRRLSIYPTLSSVAAVPVFALARLAFPLDETGSALAGKWAASLLSALAAALLFAALARRWPTREAGGTAALLVFGTSVWSTSQALWQHPLAVLAVCGVLYCLVRAEGEEGWAGRAGLPLGVLVAARHAAVGLALVLAAGIVWRWRRQALRLAAWAAPAVAFVALYDWACFGSPFRHGFSDRLGGFAGPWGIGHAGLLLSPAKGLLFFTPLAVVAGAGMARAFRGGERWLAGVLGGAALAHWLLAGRWSEWHGGESWGPRLLTEAMPLLFLFLPEGRARLPRATLLAGLLSVGAQAIGAFSYDYRWDRTLRRAGEAEAARWDPGRSPLLFYARQRVVILAAAGRIGGRAVVREHPVVLFGPTGSRVWFTAGGPALGGAEPTLGDVFPQRGALVEGGRLRLDRRWAGLFARVRQEARARRLELRVKGSGRGPLYVGEGGFWNPAARYRTYMTGGPFLVRHPFHFPESGGPDLTVTVGRGGGEVAIDWVALVAPGDPLEPLSLR